MILIAESGSTKTNWLTEDKQLFETLGFNPMVHTAEFMLTELQKSDDLKSRRHLFTRVFFYGAGCSSNERNQMVKDVLKQFFDKAEVIEVDHDLKAAAYATYTGQPGITCILGTGSNSCLFDGKEIYEEVPSLGHMLGDEGSGCVLGKRLLGLYLYHRLPEATNAIMRDTYGLTKEKIFDMVYKQPSVNRTMASFAKVLSETPDKEFVTQLVKDNFREFFKYHVACYKNYTQYPVHAVGSIASVFETELLEVATEFGSTVGIIDRNPVYRLLEWHLRKPQGV
jgi:glucosamine kinase